MTGRNSRRKSYKMTVPTFLIVDLFCGAGGTTTGFAMAANGIARVIACVNHDHRAIESHWKNHPEVKHFEEDIRTLDLTELVEVVKFQQSLYPSAKLILWASLECTNFSKAKGGQPRKAVLWERPPSDMLIASWIKRSGLNRIRKRLSMSYTALRRWPPANTLRKAFSNPPGPAAFVAAKTTFG